MQKILSVENINNQPTITVDEITKALGIDQSDLSEYDRSYINGDLESLNNDPDAIIFYREVLLGCNQEYLRQESKKTLVKLKKMVQPKLLDYIKTNGPFAGIKNLLIARRKLVEFLAYAELLQPVRQDADLSIEGEFQSPANLGIAKRGIGGYDSMVMAHHYVYGTLDQISHPMGRISNSPVNHDPNMSHGAMEYGAKEHGRRFLDEKNITDKAEIVMMDIADVSVCTRRLKRSAILTYLGNIFDYKIGKEILGYYLAYVFDDLDEAKTFLEHNCTRHCAESWQKDYSGRVDNTGYDLGSNFRWPNERGDLVGWENDKTGKLTRIQKRMWEIFDATGILPPLELEVRVRDSAKIKEGC